MGAGPRQHRDLAVGSRRFSVVIWPMPDACPRFYVQNGQWIIEWEPDKSLDHRLDQPISQ